MALARSGGRNSPCKDPVTGSSPAGSSMRGGLRAWPGGARRVQCGQPTGAAGEQGPQVCQAPTPVRAQDRAVVASSAGGRSGQAFLGGKGLGLAVSECPLLPGGWAGPSAPTGGSRCLALQGPQWPWAPQAHRKCVRPDSGADDTGKRTAQLGAGRGPGSVPAAQRGSLPVAASAGDPVTQASPHVWVREPSGTAPSPTPHRALW